MKSKIKTNNGSWPSNLAINLNILVLYGYQPEECHVIP